MLGAGGELINDGRLDVVPVGLERVLDAVLRADPQTHPPGADLRDRLPDQPTEVPAFPRREPRHGKPHDRDRVALREVERLAHQIGRHAGDPREPARGNLDEADARQPLQRLTDRHARDAELLREFGVLDRRTGRECARDDRILYAVEDDVRQSGGRRERFERREHR